MSVYIPTDPSDPTPGPRSSTVNLSGEVSGKSNNNIMANSAVLSKVLTTLSTLPGIVSTSDTIASGISKLSTTLNTATSSSTPSTLVQRDGTGGATFAKVTATSLNLATSAGASKVLTSDATGNATWQTPTAATGVATATPSSLMSRDGSANTAVAKLTANSIQCSGLVSTGTQVQNKVLAIYESGTIGDVTDQRFYGFGISSSPGTLRYQLSDVANAHVFYAATAATTSNELFRIAGSGVATSSGTLTFGTRLQPKLLSLYDMTPLSTANHNFYGLGMDTATMRYQVDRTTANHTFYAAATNTTSNTLMNIGGNGVVTIPGTLLLPAGAGATKILTSDAAGNASWQAPAAVVGVTAATPSTLMARDGSGNANVAKLTASSLQITSGAASSAVLTSDGAGNASWQALPAGLYYNTYDFTPTFTCGGYTTPPITVNLTRIGRCVTMMILTQFSSSGQTPGQYFKSNTQFYSLFWIPTLGATASNITRVTNNGNNETGSVVVDNNGYILFYPQNYTTGFTGTGTISFAIGGANLSWSI